MTQFSSDRGGAVLEAVGITVSHDLTDVQHLSLQISPTRSLTRASDTLMLISILNVTTFLFEVPCSIPCLETTILLVLFDSASKTLWIRYCADVLCWRFEISLVGTVEIQILYAEVCQAYKTCLFYHSKDKHS